MEFTQSHWCEWCLWMEHRWRGWCPLMKLRPRGTVSTSSRCQFYEDFGATWACLKMGDSPQNHIHRCLIVVYWWSFMISYINICKDICFLEENGNGLLAHVGISRIFRHTRVDIVFTLSLKMLNDWQQTTRCWFLVADTCVKNSRTLVAFCRI